MNVKYQLPEQGPSPAFHYTGHKSRRSDRTEVKELLWIYAKVIQIKISSPGHAMEGPDPGSAVPRCAASPGAGRDISGASVGPEAGGHSANI